MNAEAEKMVADLCLGLQGPMAQWVKLLAEEVAYENIPLGSIKGRQGTADFLAPFVGDGHNCLAKNEILNTVSSGNIVMNERVETWVQGDVTSVLPVCGVFKFVEAPRTPACPTSARKRPSRR